MSRTTFSATKRRSAAQFKRGELLPEFTLGDGKIYRGYENAPLEPESRYKVYLRGITEHNGVRRS